MRAGAATSPRLPPSTPLICCATPRHKRLGLARYAGAEGEARAAMSRIDETRPFIPVRIAVLTVSDTRTQKTDKSGPLLVSMIKEAGHELAEHAIVEDDPKAIRKQVKRWIKDPRCRCGDHHRRHGLHRARRDAGSGEAAIREGDRRLLGAVSHAELPEGRHLDGAVARLRRARARAPISSACRARRGLARMRGTASSKLSSTIATGPARSSRSCRGSRKRKRPRQKTGA